ncbi:hypothetical protein BTO30_14260 [Domibacillus antri]|uniref:Uncharacterized protein n=1 Tax=Domibacillus antri TaxID=1714264 RepID=A0A1Q8Q2J7_9BACI|nr:hypothetical protein BTO30_14260 [Domibacillus antri]
MKHSFGEFYHHTIFYTKYMPRRIPFFILARILQYNKENGGADPDAARNVESGVVSIIEIPDL